MVLANSSPIDPIKLEYDKISHSISITHIPDYNKLTIFNDSSSIDYLEKIDTINCTINSQYRLLDELAITGSLTLRVINQAEYLNNEMLKSSRDNNVIFTTGMRYDNYSIPINPSLEISYTYPNSIRAGLSGSIIKDPLIHTIALYYSPKLNNRPHDLTLVQSLGFLANDRTSLRLSIVSLLSDKYRLIISSITLSASYSLDPDKKKNITLNNSFRFLDSGIGLSLGTSYSF